MIIGKLRENENILGMLVDTLYGQIRSERGGGSIGLYSRSSSISL